MPVEVVVVDCSAGSAAPTDVERLLADARVTVTAGTQSSAALARNRGVRAARGRWLAFLDDSDLWAPGHLATMLHEARRR